MTQKQYALLGHPLGHSLSPYIHTRLLAESGEKGLYRLLDAPVLEEAIESLHALQGFNITIPYKTDIIPYLDELDETAKRYQSVNCVAPKDGRLIGYNTDCDGFLQSVRDFPMDGKVLQVGCGGVGRMMAIESLRAGARLTIGILPRHRERVEQFLIWLRQSLPNARVCCRLTQELDEPFDVILNASPVGMYPNAGECSVPDRLIQKANYFFDVVYNPTQTLLLQKARAYGKPAVGGMAMLVLQAARAQEIWNGSRFSRDFLLSLIEDCEAIMRQDAIRTRRNQN